MSHSLYHNCDESLLLFLLKASDEDNLTELFFGDGGPWNKRRRFGYTGTVDDFPFLHGGNSKDPLNLKSVKPVDEAENMKPIDIIIPKNIHDPLNLRNVNKNRARRFFFCCILNQNFFFVWDLDDDADLNNSYIGG